MLDHDLVPRHFLSSMHLFLIRHGETEHNVAGLLAGVTDSKLTNHGVLQTQRLAKHLINDRSLMFTHIYASDLQRASMTASEIQKAQQNVQNSTSDVPLVQLELLREQDFGSLELVSWSSRHEQNSNTKLPKSTNPDFKPKETTQAMRQRATTFLKDFIAPLQVIEEEDKEEIRVAIVSHGLFLGCLWRVMLEQFPETNVELDAAAGLVASGRSIEHLPSWTNTGCLELLMTLSDLPLVPEKDSKHSDGSKTPSLLVLRNSMLKIIAVNSKEHLLNLKRTRGGVGSAAFDQRQRSIDLFFKKPKLKRPDDPD